MKVSATGIESDEYYYLKGALPHYFRVFRGRSLVNHELKSRKW